MTTVYVKQQMMDQAIETKKRRAKTMAILGTNPTFKKQHPDWVRDASQKNYTVMEKAVMKEIKNYQEEQLARRVKLGTIK